MAEVLITLAIIGVVAAITIPVVVNKYQKQAYYTGFMKMYNTLQTAYQLSVAENGDLNHWTFNSTYGNFLDTYIIKYLKVSKYCNDDLASCGIDDNYKISWLSYDYYEISPSEITSGYNNQSSPSPDSTGYAAYMLSDGVLLMIDLYMAVSDNSATGDTIYYYFDINGPKKGPNKMGRDVFYAGIEPIIDSSSPEAILESISHPKYRFGFPGNDDTSLETIKNGNSQNRQDKNSLLYFMDMTSSCSTEVESEGKSCGRRLLLEGKMNY